LSDASKDENAVLFTRKHQAEVDAVREHVENYITARHATPARASAQPDIADQIRKLAELRDAGILTSEEFEAKKADLLERL
jgi:Short C-terminal domain